MSIIFYCVWNKAFLMIPTYLFTLQRHYLYYCPLERGSWQEKLVLKCAYCYLQDPILGRSKVTALQTISETTSTGRMVGRGTSEAASSVRWWWFNLCYTKQKQFQLKRKSQNSEGSDRRSRKCNDENRQKWCRCILRCGQCSLHQYC